MRSKISGIQKRTQKMMMMAINNNQVKNMNNNQMLYPTQYQNPGHGRGRV